MRSQGVDRIIHHVQWQYLREIIAKLGQAAKLASPLGLHDLRHTFAKSLLDPAAYGLDGPAMLLPAIQQLLGHADIATTTIYTRVSTDDLARMVVCLKHSKDKLR